MTSCFLYDLKNHQYNNKSYIKKSESEVSTNHKSTQNESHFTATM